MKSSLRDKPRKSAKAMSITVKAALIGGGFLVLAAIISGIFTTFDKSSPTSSQSVNLTGSNVNNSGIVAGSISNASIDNSIGFAQTNFGMFQGQINSPQQPLNLTQIFNNYNASNTPDTELRGWVTNLNQRLETNIADVQLTRSDLITLTKLLAKIDERTSGIEKLPDGRTGLGGVIGGRPYLLIAALTNATEKYHQHDYPASLEEALRAVDLFEKSARKSMLEEGALKPEGKGIMYALVARSAQKLGSNRLANDFAQKAFEAESSLEYRKLLVTTLFNQGQDERKLNSLTNALTFYHRAVTNYEAVVAAGENFLAEDEVKLMYGVALDTAKRLKNNELVPFFWSALIALNNKSNTSHRATVPK